MAGMKSIAAVITLFLLFVSSVDAQYSLNISGVDTSGFPSVKLRVVTKNGAILVRSLTGADYTITEDGIAQATPAFTANQGTIRFSIGVLICNGSSMKSLDFEKGRNVINAIISQMDGIFDEMAIMTYGTTSNSVQEMTTVRGLLSTTAAAINLNAAEGNRMWDAIANGLNEVKNGTERRAMLVITNGRDDGSTNSLSSVLQRNQTVGARVFVLGLGMTGTVPELVTLANTTGGAFFTDPDLTQQLVVDSLRGTPDYCTLTYTSNNTCRDGQPRLLSVGANFHPGTASDDTLMNISASSAGNVAIQIRIDSGTVSSGKTVTLPVRLLTAVSSQRFYPAQLQLTYDTSITDLTSITYATNLCKDNSFAITRNATGAMVDITGTSVISSTGILFNLVFSGKQVQVKSTTAVAPVLTFTRGCLLPTIAAGKVTVQPKVAALTAKSSTYEFAWDDVAKAYSPRHVEMNVEVTNTGDLPLTNLMAVFPADSAVHVAWGYPDTVAVAPATLQPGGKGNARFIVAAVPRSVDLVEPVNAAITCAEGATASGEAQFVIRASTSALALSGDADTVVIDNGAYVPARPAIRARILSAGSGASTAGEVGIVLPSALTLVSGAPTRPFTAMNAGAVANYDWRVAIPQSGVDQVYPVLLTLTNAGYMNDTVRVMLRVPGLLASNVVVATPTGVPATIAYDTVAKAYRPAEFNVFSEFLNTGNVASDSVFAGIQSDLPLRSGEVGVKLVKTSIAPGDSAFASWTIDAPTSALCGDSVYRIVFRAYTCCPERTLRLDTLRVTVLARPNLPPEIVARTPVVADTVIHRDSLATFSVVAIDDQNNPLTYTWKLNNVTVGSNLPTYSQAFTQMQNYTLTCEISDGCKSVTTSWSFVLTGIDEPYAQPGDFGITGCYPNPFSSQATVEFGIPAGFHQTVRLELIDINGRVIETLFSGVADAGVHQAVLAPPDTPAGVYLLRLRSGDRTSVHAVHFMK